jgi:hypothetical protein
MPPYQPERHFGFYEIVDTCRADDNNCGEVAVAILPVVHGEELDTVWWLCSSHAVAIEGAFRSQGLEDLRALQIIRTCQVGEQSPCGAAATHVAVHGTRKQDGSLEVSASSVCRRHVEGEA